MADNELDKTIIMEANEEPLEDQTLDDLDFDLADEEAVPTDDEPLITDDFELDGPSSHETTAPQGGGLGADSDDDWEQTVQALPDESYDHDPFAAQAAPPQPDPEPAPEPDPPVLEEAAEPSGAELLQSPPVKEEKRKKKGGGRGGSYVLTIISLLLAVISLIIAIIFGFMMLNTRTEVNLITNDVQQLQERPARVAAGADGDAPGVGAQLLEELRARIDALEGKMASAGSEQAETLMDELQALEARVVKLEAERAELMQAAKQPAAPVKPTPPPPADKGWVINLISFTRERSAQKVKRQYTQAGYPIELQKIVIDGRTWYRLRISGFATREAAARKQAEVRAKLGVKNSWITRP